MDRSQPSLADDLLQRMLDRVRSGAWRPGTAIPSQRELVSEFGVSGVPLREALSMMKTLGILDIHHGRRSVIRRLDTQVLEQLFPLVFCLEGQQSFSQIYDLRLTLEPKAAYFAAQRRTEADIDELTRLVTLHREHVEAGDAAFFEADQRFHGRIADATGNPFFAVLQKVFAAFVIQAQVHGCSHSHERRLRAAIAHESILDAIATRDAPRASVEMEAHLRYGATHYVREQASAQRGATLS